MVLAHVSARNPTSAQLVRWGADSGELVILHDQWWRVITSAFVHVGGLHLVMNMWALWVLGTLAEVVLGRYLFVGVYIVCAVAGSLTSLYWHPVATGAGASGAIIGILGAVVSVLKFARLPLPKEVLRSTIRSLLQGAFLTLAIGIFGPIDNAAHMGGLICGLFIGLLLSLTRRADYSLQRPLRQICLIAPFGLMVPLAFAVQRHGEHQIHAFLAAEALNAKQLDLAEKEARMASNQAPKSAYARDLLGEVLFQKGDDGAAATYFRESIAQNPRDEFATNRLALIGLKEHDAIGARDLLMKALPLQPQNAYGQLYLGRALQTLNQDNEAAAHYRQALQLSPDFYDAELALAGLYEKHNQPKDAILFYNKAAQSHPNQIEPLEGLARTYLAIGMKQDADKVIAEIRKKQVTGNRD